MVSSLLEVFGFLLVVGGLFLAFGIPVAMVAAGVGLIVGAQAVR